MYMITEEREKKKVCFWSACVFVHISHVVKTTVSASCIMKLGWHMPRLCTVYMLHHVYVRLLLPLLLNTQVCFNDVKVIPEFLYFCPIHRLGMNFSSVNIIICNVAGKSKGVTAEKGGSSRV